MKDTVKAYLVGVVAMLAAGLILQGNIVHQHQERLQVVNEAEHLLRRTREPSSDASDASVASVGVSESGSAADEVQGVSQKASQPSQPTTQQPQPLEAGGSTSRIRFFCMQTKASNAWCKMLHSASAHGVEIHHPTWGFSYTHAKRIGWVLDSVRVLPPDTVVSFCDGTDVMFNGGPGEILRRFESMEKKWGRNLFFNAEKSCYAQQAFSSGSCSKNCQWALRKARCITEYRNSVWRNGTEGVSKWRYLNAGCFIGRAGAVVDFFTAVARVTYFEQVYPFKRLKSGIWCDQSMITRVLLNQAAEGKSVAGLDVENRIFLPTYHLHPKEDFCPSSGSLHTCHNKEHVGEQPLIFHLNGKSEKPLWEHTRSMALSFASKNSSAVHYVSGKKQLLSEICK